MSVEVQHLNIRQHFATPLLVNEFTLTTDSLSGVIPKPDPILQFFSVGSNQFTFPLRTVTSVSTRTRFRLLRLVLAVFGILLGFVALSGGPNWAVIFLLAGVWVGLQVYSAELVISDASRSEGVSAQVSVLDRKAVRSFVESVNRAVTEASTD